MFLDMEPGTQWLSDKELTCNPGYARDVGSIPELGRSRGEGNGNPLQYSCLENPMDCSLPGFSVHGVIRAGHDLATKPPPPPPQVRYPCCESQSLEGFSLMEDLE